MASGSSSPLSSIFAQNLRSARRDAGLTQHGLAIALGRGDAMTISRWERGENRPSDENLMALAEVLGRDVSWFFSEPDEAAVEATG